MPVFESSVRTASVAAAGTHNMVFSTGSTPAVFLARNVNFAGAGFTAEVYEAPTGVTGGTASLGYASDQIGGSVPKGAMTTGVTITTPGTKIAATSFYRGTASNNPNQAVGTFGTLGGSRRLKPNTTYLLQFTNNDSAAQTLDVYFRWYEGADPTPAG